jgi:hypothetical protein
MTTIFERLFQESSVAVMVHATLESAFASEESDEPSAQTVHQHYARCVFPPWLS